MTELTLNKSKQYEAVRNEAADNNSPIKSHNFAKNLNSIHSQNNQ